MKVIVVANQKGGVGKSTIACNLAVAAAMDGKKTLVIDADPQGSSATFRTVRESDDIKVISIVKPTIHKDIQDFSNFDWVIVDSGGRDSAVFRSAIAAAEGGILVIPILPSQYDIWATEDTFNILKEARAYKDIPAVAFFNQVMQNTTVTRDAAETLQELTAENEVSLLASQLAHRVDYKKSISAGQGVMEYAPGGKAAQEVAALYAEIRQWLEAEVTKDETHAAKAG